MRRNDSRPADNNPAFHIACQNDWSGCEKRVLFFAKRDSNPKISVRQRSDGGRSSMVELQIVVLVAAGSSPVGHPLFQIPQSRVCSPAGSRPSLPLSRPCPRLPPRTPLLDPP